MDRFVRRENIRHFRDLLRDAQSDAERQRIQILLDEELAKQKAAGDDSPLDTLRSGPRAASKIS